MLTYKIELKELALEVNELLTEYIFLHDTLQKKSNSFLGIFKPIDFNELYHKAGNVAIKLEDKLSEALKLKKVTIINSEKEFADCLCEYIQALITTVGLYKEMVGGLLQKAGGSKLSLREHMRQSKFYEESINRYMEIGQKLNNLYKAL